MCKFNGTCCHVCSVLIKKHEKYHRLNSGSSTLRSGLLLSILEDLVLLSPETTCACMQMQTVKFERPEPYKYSPIDMLTLPAQPNSYW